MRKKIARLVPNLPPLKEAYGYFITFHKLNQAQREIGNQVNTFYPQYSQHDMSDKGNDMHPVPVTKLTEFSFGLRLSSKLDDYDIIHSHARIGLPYAFFDSGGPPIVVHLHGLPYHFTDSIAGPAVDRWTKIHDLRAYLTYTTMLSSADHIITYCKGLADKVVEQFDLDIESVSWIDNGIDPELFRKSGPTAKTNLQGSPTILYVGRLSAVKGIYTITGSLHALVERFPEIRIIFLGCDGGGLRLPQNLSHNVTVIPHVPHSHIPAYYRCADAHIALTQTYGYQKTVLESLACGVPVIATDNSDNRYVAGNAGIYVDPLSEQQLVDAISQVAEQTKFQRNAARKSKKIRERFSWRRTAERIEEIYEIL